MIFNKVLSRKLTPCEGPISADHARILVQMRKDVFPEVYTPLGEEMHVKYHRNVKVLYGADV